MIGYSSADKYLENLIKPNNGNDNEKKFKTVWYYKKCLQLHWKLLLK